MTRIRPLVDALEATKAKDGRARKHDEAIEAWRRRRREDAEAERQIEVEWRDDIMPKLKALEIRMEAAMEAPINLQKRRSAQLHMAKILGQTDPVAARVTVEQDEIDRSMEARRQAVSAVLAYLEEVPDFYWEGKRADVRLGV